MGYSEYGIGTVPGQGVHAQMPGQDRAAGLLCCIYKNINKMPLNAPMVARMSTRIEKVRRMVCSSELRG